MTEPAWTLMIQQALPGGLGASADLQLQSTGALYVSVDTLLRGRQEIGRYFRHISPEQAQQLDALVEEQGVWRLPGLKFLKPGQPTLSFSRFVGGKPRGASWPVYNVPAELEPVLREFHRLVDETRDHPRLVLAGEARWLRPSVAAGEPLGLEMILRNVGREAFSFQCPETPDYRPSLLTLITARPPREPGGEAVGHRHTPIPPSAIFPTGAPTAPAPSPGAPLKRVAMAPGDTRRYTLRPSAVLSPGTYQAVLLFDCLAGGAPRSEAVTGRLAMELPPLTILP